MRIHRKGMNGTSEFIIPGFVMSCLTYIKSRFTKSRLDKMNQRLDFFTHTGRNKVRFDRLFYLYRHFERAVF